MRLKSGPILCTCSVCEQGFERYRNRGNMSVCTPCQRKTRLAEWLAAHHGKKNEYNRKWSAANPLREAEMKKAWELSNKPALNHRAALHRAKKRSATPSWANIAKIKEIYAGCPKGFHVDHIIPLNGKTVTGLHVEANLQYLSACDNRIKSNYFEGNP